jgi:hypothetical protein
MNMQPIESDANTKVHHSTSPVRSRPSSPVRSHNRDDNRQEGGSKLVGQRRKDDMREDSPAIGLSSVERSSPRRHEKGEDRWHTLDSDMAEGPSHDDASHSPDDNRHEKGIILEHVRREIIQRRLEDSGNNSRDRSSTLGLAHPTMATDLSDSRRQELLNRLKEEKERIDTSTSLPNSESTHDSLPSGGIQIKGAAAKAKELALQKMEQRLRTQALLRIKLAHEKSQLVASSGEASHISPSSPTKAMDNMTIPLPKAEPSMQQKLRERLLRERLLLSRGTSTIGSLRPDP